MRKVGRGRGGGSFPFRVQRLFLSSDRPTSEEGRDEGSQVCRFSAVQQESRLSLVVQPLKLSFPQQYQEFHLLFLFIPRGKSTHDCTHTVFWLVFYDLICIKTTVYSECTGPSRTLLFSESFFPPLDKVVWGFVSSQLKKVQQ